MAEVEFLTSVGGDGTVISDDANPSTGLAKNGHRTRFIKALQQLVAVAAYVVTKAQEAAASALTALNAPGTWATSATPQTWDGDSVGEDFTWTIQTGKAIAAGMDFKAARTSAAATQALYGVVDSYDSATGVIVLTIVSVVGTGTNVSDWTLSLSQNAGIPSSRTIAAGGIATGGGDLSTDRTITVSKASAAEIAGATEDGKVVTPKGQSDALDPEEMTDQATLVPDFSTRINRKVTIAASRTLGKPTGYRRGWTYTVEIWNTGAFSITAFHACYEGGALGLPEISQGAGKITLLTLYCLDADPTNPRFRLAANLDS